MIKLLFDSWRGHTLDNGLMDLEDDAYEVLVLSASEEEEEEEPPAQDEAGPSGTTGEEEPEIVDGGESLFPDLDEGTSKEDHSEQASKESKQLPAIMCQVTTFNGDVIPDGN
jgi:hypothetical protein